METGQTPAGNFRRKVTADQRGNLFRIPLSEWRKRKFRTSKMGVSGN